MHERLVGLMSAPLGPVIALLVGVAIGLMFYTGLWWTVRQAATFRRPGLSVLTSFLLRTSIALGGFYIVAGNDWTRVLMCLTGFLLARAAVTWGTRLPSSPERASRGAIGARRAP